MNYEAPLSHFHALNKSKKAKTQPNKEAHGRKKKEKGAKSK